MRNNIQCNQCENDTCFVKKYCTDEAMEKFSISQNQDRYKKGDYIFREGNSMSGIYFIQTGGVKIVASNSYGREQIVRLAIDGDILGHRALGKDKYYFSAIAMKDTLVCFVESDIFRDTCMSSQNFAYNFILFYALELRRAELRVKYQGQMNIREKVAWAFVHFYEKFGLNPQTKILNVELGRDDIAQLAGTTAEQVTRQLSDFESEKLISRQKRAISILNIKGLEYIVRYYKID